MTFEEVEYKDGAQCSSSAPGRSCCDNPVLVTYFLLRLLHTKSRVPGEKAEVDRLSTYTVPRMECLINGDIGCWRTVRALCRETHATRRS